MHRTSRDTWWRIMSAMLGVIETSRPGSPMRVLLREHAGLCIGPNIIPSAFAVVRATRRFEAKLRSSLRERTPSRPDPNEGRCMARCEFIPYGHGLELRLDVGGEMRTTRAREVRLPR
jgi:hypothetical protein